MAAISVSALSTLGHLDARIREALDNARGNAAALARSAHEILDTAHAEPTSTADGTTGRARLIDSESVRVALTAASLHQNAGRLAAFGEVLAMLDRVRAEEHEAAIGRIEAEAARDAVSYRDAVTNDGETQTPEQWAPYAFAAWVDDTGPDPVAPLTRDEARTSYVTAFLRRLALLALTLLALACGGSSDDPGPGPDAPPAAWTCADGVLTVDGPVSVVWARYDVAPGEVLAHRWAPAAWVTLEGGGWIAFDFAAYAPVPAGAEARMWTSIVPAYDAPICPIDVQVTE